MSSDERPLRSDEGKPKLLLQDQISDIGRLAKMLGIALGIEFIMLLVAFGVGHYLGQQTVPQAIHVDAPVVKAQNDFVIDTHLAIREEQKQPAQFKISLSQNGNGGTVIQEQVEKLEKSMESVVTKIDQISNGMKSSAEGSSTRAGGQEKPPPVRISLESASKSMFDVPAKAVATVPVEVKPVEAKPEKLEKPPEKTSQAMSSPTRRTLGEKLSELFDGAKAYCTHYEKTFGSDERKKWEQRWSTRLSDPGLDENRVANEALITRLKSIFDKKSAKQAPDQKEIYETCLVLCRYTAPSMQLPGPFLEIIKKDDEKDFQEAVGFLRVAKME